MIAPDPTGLTRAALVASLVALACSGADVPPCSPSRVAMATRDSAAGHDLLALNEWRRVIIDSARPGSAVFVIPADLDGDGRTEVLAGQWVYSSRIGSLGPWERHLVGGGLGNIAAVADFDGDTNLDALGTKSKGDSPESSEFVLRLGDGCGGFRRSRRIPRGEGDFLQGVAVGHFTSERDLEVAVSWHSAGSGIQLLTSSAAHPEASKWVLVSGISQDEQLSAADMDLDGRTDLVLGTRWLHNLPGGFVLDTLDVDSGSPDRNRVADVDGDGWPDVVVGFEAISVPGLLAWYRNPGSTGAGWTREAIDEVVGPMSLDLGDLDLDGDVDVVVGEHNLKNPASARLLIYENLGAGQAWKQHVVHTGDEHHDGAQLLDVDADGDLDIVSIGWGHNRVLLYENLAIP